jgi:hypothetical protein
MRSAASKAMWVGRATVSVVGLAVIMALVLGVASAAFGANGDKPGHKPRDLWVERGRREARAGREPLLTPGAFVSAQRHRTPRARKPTQGRRPGRHRREALP